jgi:hypothetical protein
MIQSLASWSVNCRTRTLVADKVLAGVGAILVAMMMWTYAKSGTTPLAVVREVVGVFMAIPLALNV